MTAIIVRADARALPLADASVDLVVTSPPYYALRSYTDGGEHYEGQIGSEATPAEYIAALLDCTREWARVLKPTGSILVELGDKYGRPGGGADRNPRSLAGAGRGTTERLRTPNDGGGRDKCLMLLPERYRIAAVDQLGLIARAVIVASKPNGLPESVTDRVRRSHEDWVHLTKEPRYFSAIDEIREPHAPQSIARTRRNRFAPDLSQAGVGAPNTLNPVDACNPLGKLPGSVWEIASEPLTVPAHLDADHFAAFAIEWPRRIILGWSPAGICVECGEGRRPVVATERVATERVASPVHRHGSIMGSRRSPGDIRGWDGLPRFNMARSVAGYSCACTPYTDHSATGSTRRRPYSPGVRDNNAQGTYGRHQAGEYERVGPWREYHLDDWTPAPTRPAVVLDPFGGTGTTALAASALGRIGISVDMSADYCRIARWRTADPAQRAKVLGVPKPPVEVAGQLDLLDELGGVA